MHLGIVGYGSISKALIGYLESEPVAELTLLVRPKSVAVTQAALRGSAAAGTVTVVDSAAALAARGPDLVVECAGHSAVGAYLPTLLRGGVNVVMASVGAMADDTTAEALRAAAAAGGAQLVLPAGAIGGIDILAAIAPAGGLSVSYRGIKPPRAWAGSPAENAVDLGSLETACVFFSGSAREAASAYPKNANVAAALAVAGAGFDDTRVELVADPAAPGNLHAYEVESPVARYSITIENMPAPENPRTSLATAFSLLREINRVRRPVVI